jgi:predicted DNA-binding transcriptional regulator AlpA
MDSSTSNLLDIQQVAHRLRISIRTAWRWVGNGQLPPPIRLSGGRITRWRATYIDRWIDQLAARR